MEDRVEMGNERNMASPHEIILGGTESTRAKALAEEACSLIGKYPDDRFLFLGIDPSLLPCDVQILKPGKETKVNPLDLDIGGEWEFESPSARKYDFVIDFFEYIKGSECTAAEKGEICLALKRIYSTYVFEVEKKRELGGISFDRDLCPTLEDLYKTLLDYSGENGRRLALMLEIFISKNSFPFNGKTDEEVFNSKRLLFLNTKTTFEPLVKSTILESAWNMAVSNKRDRMNRIWVFANDIGTLATSYSLSKIFKGGRPYNLIVTGAAKDLSSFPNKERARGIMNNCGNYAFLKMSECSMNALSELFCFSEEERKRMESLDQEIPFLFK